MKLDLRLRCDLQEFSLSLPRVRAALFRVLRISFVAPPEEPGESCAGAQDGEGQGEEAVLEVVMPGGVDDEPGGDAHGGEYAEKGEGEHDPEPGTRGVARRGYFVTRVRHAGPQSPLLAGSVEVFSGVVLLESEEPFALDSPLVAAAFFGSSFGPFLLL